MSSSSKKAILEWLFVGVIMVLLSVPLWLKVDQLPIRLWDEAQNAVNALEMSQTHNWLVRTYDYQPDTFDCKPPLLIWFQVLSIKALGLTELSIRLPSVVFSILSCFILFALIYTMTDKKRLEQNEGLKIGRTTFTSLQVGDTILSHHKMVYDSLRKDYRVEVLDSSYQHTKLTVLHPKDTAITYHQTTL